MDANGSVTRRTGTRTYWTKVQCSEWTYRRRIPERCLLEERFNVSGEPVICIIDDDPSVRRALARLVRSCGLPAETFASAREYLEAPHADGVACVVLDVHLGQVSGLELRERIVAQPSPPPVILMTAHDDAATREKIRKCGAPGYLCKPFESTALFLAIGQAIGRDLIPSS